MKKTEAPSNKAVNWVNNLENWDIMKQALPETKAIMKDIDPPFAHASLAAHIDHVKKTTCDERFLNISPKRSSITCSKFFYLAIEQLRARGC